MGDTTHRTPKTGGVNTFRDRTDAKPPAGSPPAWVACSATGAGRGSKVSVKGLTMRPLTAQLSNPIPKLPTPTDGPARLHLVRTRGRRLPPDDIERLTADYLRGCGVVELARTYGIHRDTVHRHLTRAGITTTSGPILDDEVVSRIAGRCSAGESCAVIARDVRVDPSTIANTFRRAGIKLRPRKGAD